MAGKDVSYQFLDALAKSIGMDAQTIKQALAEINQLQTKTQALELAVQGKAPTNHASQQPIFGTANEQMYGHVKIAHEVANDSTDGVAVSPDAVYTYAPNRDTTPLGIVTRTMASIINDGELVSDAAYAQISGSAVTVCWGNHNYTNIDLIEVLIPPIYKFETFANYNTCTNSGNKVCVSYGADAILTVQSTDRAKASDSILIFMTPKNA
jgi:uncharacterized protein YukE